MGASITLTPVPSAVTAGPAGSYTRGEELVIEWTVKNTSGVLTAPDEITFTVRTPGGVDTEYTTADPELVDDADGTGTLTLVLDESARWVFRCVTDTPTTAAELSVQVAKSPFETPVLPVPGAPGIANEGAIARAASGVYSPYLATEEGETLTAREVGGIFFWVKERGWIRPSVDLTGAVDASTSISTALTAAGNRPGSCVYLPEGRIRVGSGSSDVFTVPPGITVTGPERGHRRSARLYGPGSALDQAGAQLEVRSTGKLFTLGHQATVCNLEIYYPNQETDAAPGVYDWAFYATGNSHQVTIANITAVNPYQFIYLAVNGARLDQIYGWPLSRGLRLGRCADVARVSNLHFNRNVSPNAGDFGSTLTAWVAANGYGVVIDGAEQFDFTDCFVWGYDRGFYAVDLDADGFGASYGTWKGGGFDSCGTCVWVGNPVALSYHGMKLVGCALAPASAGYGVRLDDDFTPASAYYRPGVYMHGCTIGGGTQYLRGIWGATTTHGFVQMHGGAIQNFTEYGARASGSNFIAALHGVAMPTTMIGSAVRISGTGVAEYDSISL